MENDNKVEALKLKHKRLLNYLQGALAISLGIIASRIVGIKGTGELFVPMYDWYIAFALIFFFVCFYAIQPQLIKVEKQLFELKNKKVARGQE